MRKNIAVAVLVLLCSVNLVFAQTEEVGTPVPDVVVEVPEEGVIEVPEEGVIEVPGDGSIVIVDESENPVLLVVLVVVAVLATIFGGALVLVLRTAFNQAPQWLVELALENREWAEARIDAGFDELDRLAALTPNTLDDLIAKYGREWVENRLREILGDQSTPPPANPA